MRNILMYLCAVVLAAGVGAGITYHAMADQIQHAQVSSFNDGFMDGVCHDGLDGFGHPCK
ncbi:hypothetical protein GCM10010341_08120 [Streptomyces noursei]|nr:hypothetical protein GCM10010341_08120 [Streptomyces noursei]